MGVDMAIDVGGPACRVFYQQAKGDLVHWDPNNYQPLALYSRSATSPGTADTKWRDLSHSQQKPHIELPDGTSFCLLPRVVLPRHVPLTPQVVKVHTITNNVSLFTEPHTVAPRELFLSSLLRYRPDESSKQLVWGTSYGQRPGPSFESDKPNSGKEKSRRTILSMAVPRVPTRLSFNSILRPLREVPVTPLPSSYCSLQRTVGSLGSRSRGFPFSSPTQSCASTDQF